MVYIYRAFVLNGELQNISDISFDRIDELNLNIQNIDFGHKRFVFQDVRYLTITGNLGESRILISPGQFLTLF